MGSLVARSVAAMAFNSTRVVDVAALVASPIIRTGDVVFATGFAAAFRTGKGVRLGLIAAFAAIAEVKVQKRAFDTVPLSVVFLTLPASPISVSGPGPRSLPLLFVPLLLSLTIGVQHDRLQKTQLRFNDSRYSLHNIYLGCLYPIRRCGIKIILDGILGLRRIGIVMHWLSHVIVSEGIDGRNGGIHYHVVLLLGHLPPVEAVVVTLAAGVGWRRGEVVGLRSIIVNRHWRRVVSLDMAVHLRKIGDGSIATHRVELATLTVSIIRLPIHHLRSIKYYTTSLHHTITSSFL